MKLLPHTGGMDYPTKKKLFDSKESELNGAEEKEKTASVDMKSAVTRPDSASLEYRFALDTSCHGLRHLVNSRSMFWRVVWSLAVLVAFLSLVIGCIRLLNYYLSYSTLSEIEIEVLLHFVVCVFYFS